MLMRQALLIPVSLLAAMLLIAGCTTPSKANVELRKQNRELRDEMANLNRVHEADQASLRTLQSSRSVLPTLPGERIDELFTTHGLSFGRLTGGGDLEAAKPGDEALKIYIVPLDQYGDVLKAAGAFTVEAFDLDRPGEQKIGQWEFPVDQAEKNWYGGALLYTYVLTCPWQTVPQHSKLTIQVTFLDALTQRTFTQRREITIVPPPMDSPQPTTNK